MFLWNELAEELVPKNCFKNLCLGKCCFKIIVSIGKSCFKIILVSIGKSCFKIIFVSIGKSCFKIIFVSINKSCFENISSTGKCWFANKKFKMVQNTQKIITLPSLSCRNASPQFGNGRLMLNWIYSLKDLKMNKNLKCISERDDWYFACLNQHKWLLIF